MNNDNFPAESYKSPTPTPRNITTPPRLIKNIKRKSNESHYKNEQIIKKSKN
jgi:hypothetical protein